MTSEHKPSILIVDDDETYRNRLARAFVDRGYDVRTAQDYDSAIALATSQEAGQERPGAGQVAARDRSGDPERGAHRLRQHRHRDRRGPARRGVLPVQA